MRDRRDRSRIDSIRFVIASNPRDNAGRLIYSRLGEGHGDTRVREFRDVTPLSWGHRFSLEQVPNNKFREILFVNAEAMRVLEAHGGQE